MKPYLHTVGVVVQDMTKTLAFYRTLGLEIDTKEDEESHVEYTSPSGYSIGFVTEAMVRQTDPKWSDGFGNRINLQFAFAAPSEVDATYERLMGAGYESYQEPWDAFWGQRFARVIDPNRNVVNLFAALGE
jgi:uncharacterized glyoxalase superfamily protein PhnB